jgi:hypothetical protein
VEKVLLPVQAPNEPAAADLTEVFKGVKINCTSDQDDFNKPHFEAVDLPANDPIFSNHSTSEIGELVGLSIFTRRCEPDLFSGIYTRDGANNQDASSLHLCCYPKAKENILMGTLGWGYASVEMYDPTGSILMVRQDGLPLTPLQAEALCKYCRYEIQPLMVRSHRKTSSNEFLSRSDVLSLICKRSFEVFWLKFKDEKGKEGVEFSKVDTTFPLLD